jgi:dTDP-4-dehydrorhamnose reductase
LRTLVFGGGGIVGGAMVAEASRRGWPVRGLGHAEVDIADSAAVAGAIARERAELVVNCAAFTQVDRCESEPELAFAVNGAAVGPLAAAAARAGARFVHLSTDYVFDGEATEPYREEHATGPRSVYGASKLEGERLALAVPGSLVVRTSWIFGQGGANFVDAIAGRIRSGDRRLRVVADQTGAPTWAPFLASALADLGEWGASGIVHYQNRPSITWHGVALEIARRLVPDGAVEVEPITTAEMPRPARRPAYSVLAVERFEALAGRRVEGWSAGLDRHLAMAHKEGTKESSS